MKFRATFRSGDAVIGTLDFEGSWEDFIQQYQFDEVLQAKVRFESIFGSPVSVTTDPILVRASQTRTFFNRWSRRVS